MDYGRLLSKRHTPQVRSARPDQSRNHAGGFAWEIDKWELLSRFLILGTEGGTYYSSEEQCTLKAGGAVEACIAEDGMKVLRWIQEVSSSGRAIKNSPAMAVLAMCMAADDEGVRRKAVDAFDSIVRTGSHLFEFCSFIEEFRGWGRVLRRAVGNWYLNQPPDRLAYQVIKYRNRYGWTHRDVLRLSHPIPDQEHKGIFEWIIKGSSDLELPLKIRKFEEMKSASNVGDVLRILEEVPDMPWESIPSEFLGDPKVWEKLAPRLPMTALLRNLGRMTASGALKPLSNLSNLIVGRITNDEALRKARIHPFSVLLAMRTYSKGGGFRGNKKWSPISQIIDALDEAYYKSFAYVEPTGKRLLIALDISGSMAISNIANSPITAREASAAMLMATAAVEPNYEIVAFAGELVPISISPGMRLDTVLNEISGLPFGATDCALPMLWAREQGIEVDGFIIYTDSETWYGDVHPFQALADYRRTSGIRDARLITVGMTANEFSIADPSDPYMFDVVGFDSNTPAAISAMMEV